MGMGAALKLKPLLANLTSILSIELLTACQAIDALAPLRTGRLAEKARALVRGVSPPGNADRPCCSQARAPARSGRRAAFASPPYIGRPHRSMKCSRCRPQLRSPGSGSDGWFLSLRW